MGKHEYPKTGTGHTGGHGPKPKKTQISQRSEEGTIIPKVTATLWGIFSGKKKR